MVGRSPIRPAELDGDPCKSIRRRSALGLQAVTIVHNSEEYARSERDVRRHGGR